MSKSKKQALAAAAVLVAVAAVLLCCWLLLGPRGQAGEKELQVTVTAAPGSDTVHKIETEAEFLGEALQEAKIIEGEAGPYGLYITAADGVTADESQQQWWCITKDGEAVMTGADSTPIADGDRFELTLKTGY
ncbi:MAG: DUF4430 domain-containing protein [Oscillospiraceae bacterium]|nr:DUF4430 domain-containing protein [Oscillospiraceae bacterium]